MNNLAKSTYVNLLSSKTFYAVKRNTNKTTAKQRTCGEKISLDVIQWIRHTIKHFVPYSHTMPIKEGHIRTAAIAKCGLLLQPE